MFSQEDFEIYVKKNTNAADDIRATYCLDQKNRKTIQFGRIFGNEYLEPGDSDKEDLLVIIPNDLETVTVNAVAPFDKEDVTNHGYSIWGIPQVDGSISLSAKVDKENINPNAEGTIFYNQYLDLDVKNIPKEINSILFIESRIEFMNGQK
jgi:hypothetical protein